MKTVLITGVSSGLGQGMAQAFCRRGYRVVGTVRSTLDAKRAQQHAGPNLVPLRLDVRDLDAVAQLPETLSRMGIAGRLAGLINNAGILRSGPVLTQPMDEMKDQFDVNVLGLIAVTQALLPMLGADAGLRGTASEPPGRIINISSVGGRVATPFIAGYNASKHAVEGFSHALRRELMPFGIGVTIVGPGAVRWSIWSNEPLASADGDAGGIYAESLALFQGMASRIQRSAFTEQEAGERILDIFEAKKAAIREPLVRGRLVNWLLPSMLPDRWLDAALRTSLKLHSR
ncbi:MAG: SDR family NAD(P)-dependent oxidoreductase [Silanimonas sp.]|jgi:NAD(P)-dependent dehydrogenase (short-subunit alcohol dehydrogenase family)|nr:SDR family NAD(P)-dependent oxidoreductase [Silanimonas sp.]